MLLYGWEAPDDGQKDCPKHVELELSAYVGFIHKESVTMHGHTILKFNEGQLNTQSIFFEKNTQKLIYPQKQNSFLHVTNVLPAPHKNKY